VFTFLKAFVMSGAIASQRKRLNCRRKKYTRSSYSSWKNKEENMQKKQKDPVCGTAVEGQSNYKTMHHDKQYNFCCQQCMDSFKKNPEKYSK